jgi:hypothetical protein
MLVWGNYCNLLGGPVPVNIYYSTDGGETVTLAYSLGRNPKFRELQFAVTSPAASISSTGSSTGRPMPTALGSQRKNAIAASFAAARPIWRPGEAYATL